MPSVGSLPEALHQVQIERPASQNKAHAKVRHAPTLILWPEPVKHCANTDRHGMILIITLTSCHCLALH